MTYIGRVKDGKLYIYNRRKFDADLLKFEMQEVKISVSRQTEKRSTESNKYYWAIINLIVLRLVELGNNYDKEFVHDMMKQKFLKRTVNINGYSEEIVLKSSELTPEQFGAYLLEVKVWGQTFLGLEIPEIGQTDMFNESEKSES